MVSAPPTLLGNGKVHVRVGKVSYNSRHLNLERSADGDIFLVVHKPPRTSWSIRLSKHIRIDELPNSLGIRVVAPAQVIQGGEKMDRLLLEFRVYTENDMRQWARALRMGVSGSNLDWHDKRPTWMAAKDANAAANRDPPKNIGVTIDLEAPAWARAPISNPGLRTGAPLGKLPKGLPPSVSSPPSDPSSSWSWGGDTPREPPTARGEAPSRISSGSAGGVDPRISAGSSADGAVDPMQPLLSPAPPQTPPPIVSPPMPRRAAAAIAAAKEVSMGATPEESAALARAKKTAEERKASIVSRQQSKKNQLDWLAQAEEKTPLSPEAI